MTTDLLDFPTIDAPQPVAAQVPAPVAPPAAATTVAVVIPSIKETVLAQFKATEADLLALAEKYRDVAYDVRTTKGMAEAVAARADLRDNGRLALTKTEARVRKDVNELKRAMDPEVDRLVAIVKPVEDAIDAQIQAEVKRKADEKAEKARIEAERIAGHQERLGKIGNYLTHCQQYGMTAARIQVGIDKLAAATFGPDWQEFAVPAANLQCETLEAMRKLHAQAVEREAEALRLEAQREEQARVAEAQAETQRQLDAAAEVLRAQQAETARQAAEVAAAQAALAAPPPAACEFDPHPAAATIGNPPFTAPMLAPLPVSEPADPVVAAIGAGLLYPPADALAVPPNPAPTSATVVLANAAAELTDLERCRMALADACDLLDGWIVSKCPKKHTAEHFAHVAKLRDMGGLPRNTTTTN